MGNKYAEGRTEELKEGNGLCSLFLYPHHDLRTPKDVRGRPMKVPGLSETCWVISVPAFPSTYILTPCYRVGAELRDQPGQ